MRSSAWTGCCHKPSRLSTKLRARFERHCTLPRRLERAARSRGDAMSDATAPTVTGPVTGGSHGWAFGGPVVDLARYGYRQDEFFLEGLAVRYGLSPGTELGWDGHWEVQPVGSAPYKTRLVVIRPEDPAAFNGTVALAWNNVTAGYDNFGGGDSVELLSGGFAFVAVSAQRVSVHGMSDNPQG